MEKGTSMQLAHDILYIVQLMRLWNAILYHIPLLFLGYFLTMTIFSSFSVIFGSIITLFLLGGGYMINDLADIEADKKNAPNRPLASGKLNSKKVIFSCILLYIIVYFLTFLIAKKSTILLFPIIIIVSLFAYLYAFYIKKFGRGIDNVSFGLMTSLIVLFGALMNNTFNEEVVIAMSGAFFYMTSLHLNATIKDVVGDRESDCKTIPIMYGKKIAYSMVLILYALSIISFLILSNMFSIVAMYIILIIGIMVGIILLFQRDNKKVWIIQKAIFSVILWILVISTIKLI